MLDNISAVIANYYIGLLPKSKKKWLMHIRCVTERKIDWYANEWQLSYQNLFVFCAID